MPRLRSRLALSVAAVTTLALGLGACGSDDTHSSPPAGTGAGSPGTVVVGAVSNGAAEETTLKVAVDQAVRAELPKKVLDSKKLVIGVGFLPVGAAPIAYMGTDQKTVTGSEADLGRLVAAVLGLEPEVNGATFENLFVGIDSGRTDVAFSNVTDTEQRKEKYDFASYRKDNLAFEVRKDDTWNFTGDFHSLAGRTISTMAGTNSEKMLLDWQSRLKAEGKKLTLKYFQDPNSTYLALNSGKIDVYFEANPAVAYHEARTAGTPQATRTAGTYSGAGDSVQGLICATTKKDNGLVKPMADAINVLIRNGQYAKWLAAWHLGNEAVPTSQVNPPGLPPASS